jgi:hypothetical protein
MSEKMLEPNCTSNLTQENVIKMQEMQSSVHENEETNSVIECSGKTTLENVPAEIISHVNGSQSMNDKQLLSDDTAESFHRQHTELSFKHKIDDYTFTEPSADLPAYLPMDSEEPIAFTDSRCMWCQTATPENLGEQYNVGVIKYSSTTNPLLNKLRRSENGHPTGEADQQMPGRSDDPDIQKLSLCEHKQDAHKRQYARNETDNIIANVMSVKARQGSTETRSDPLAPPSTYKRGVIPNYLKERHARDNARNETEYQKINAVSVKAKQQSVETARDPLKPPPTYERGVIPKYLKERRARENARNETEYQKTNAVSVKAKQQSVETARDPLKPPPTYKRGVIPKYLQERRARENERNETEYQKTNAASVKAKQRSVETACDPLKPPPTYKRGVIPKYLKEYHNAENARNESDTRKTNVMSMKAKKISNETAHDPLVPPPSYKKGVIPKYLKERREAMQKEAKWNPDFPVLACPPGHDTQNDSYRNETLKMLKKRHSDLAQELRMLPVKTDIRMMYTKKTELTKKLKETENAMKAFCSMLN